MKRRRNRKQRRTKKRTCSGQVPGSRFRWGMRNPAWDSGGGMRHRGGAKCACRMDPSTSGGAAESTSSVYACNPPERASMFNGAKPLSIFFYPHTGCYVFHEVVTRLRNRLSQFLCPHCNDLLAAFLDRQVLHPLHDRVGRHDTCLGSDTVARFDANPQGETPHPTGPLGPLLTRP
eukprot:scaffold98810_cov69-Phaeocystis_antarctica.AAC.1